MAIEMKVKRSIPWFPIIMTMIFVVFALAATYFLFFQAPPLIQRFVPIDASQDARLEQLKKIAVKPEAVTAHYVFQMLRETQVFLEPSEVGRTNPYLMFSTSTQPSSTSTRP